MALCLPLASVATGSDRASALEPLATRARMMTYAAGENDDLSRTLLTSGVVVFGRTCGSAVVIAANSERAADRHTVLKAGPWTSILGPGDCGAASVGSCEAESAKRFVIAPDVGQGVGALTIIDAFFDRRKPSRLRMAQAKPTIQVSPASLPAGAYGLLASGTF